MRALAIVALACAACGPPAEDGDASGDGSLTGAWRWTWTYDGQGLVEDILVEDKGDTLEITRCGAQAADPEVWTRDGDAITPVGDEVADPGHVKDGELKVDLDGDDGWRACRVSTKAKFDAGTFSVDDDAGGLVHADSGVCTTHFQEGNGVRVAALVDDQIASIDLDNVTTSSVGDVSTDGHIVIAAVGVNAFVAGDVIVSEPPVDGLNAQLSMSEQLDGGARHYTGEIDVVYPACD